MTDNERDLWPGLIPTGALTFLLGEPGAGKGFAAAAIAAAVTRGASWPGMPDAEAQPGSVLLLNADDPKATLLARLQNCGADLARVLIVQGVEDRGIHERPPSLVSDLPLIEAELDQAEDARLLIVDPLAAFLARDRDEPHHYRRTARALAEMAARRGVAVILVTHLKKSARRPSQSELLAPPPFVERARAFLHVHADPCDRRQRYMSVLKDDPAAPRPLAFRIESGAVHWDVDHA